MGYQRVEINRIYFELLSYLLFKMCFIFCPSLFEQMKFTPSPSQMSSTLSPGGINGRSLIISFCYFKVAARDKGREIRREERKGYRDEIITRENKEREERRRQREADLQRQDRSQLQRQIPPRFQNRGRPRSDSQDGGRKSPQRERRPVRQLPAQYRSRKASTSSSSSSSSFQ